MANSILITGANRGIGLGLVNQYAADGWRVFACCRDPQQAEQLQAIADDTNRHVTVHALDVTDLTQIQALAKELRNESIDILFNNAAIGGPKGMCFGQVDADLWVKVFCANTVAPLKMAEAFIEHVARSERKIIAAMSSTMGSITENSYGRSYLYRSTKTALNAVVKSMSIDLRDRDIIVVTLHPGWVQTDMGGEDATLTVAKSVKALSERLAGFTLADSGRFWSYDGREIPW